VIERVIHARVHAHRLRLERAAAAEASRLKTVFLMNVGHEVRTPLNAIIGFSSVLLRKKNEADEHEIAYLTRIHANGVHLLRLIDDVLEMARIEGGALVFSVSEFELEPLVRETLAELGSAADARDVRLMADLPPHLASLRTDRARVKQILVNLVGNAVKFGGDADVTVRVRADSAGHATRIEVIDQGIGLSRDQLITVFEAFNEGHMSLSREYGSTGLGLAITRSLAKSLGWRIDVDSAPGIGSTFSVVMDGASSLDRTHDLGGPPVRASATPPRPSPPSRLPLPPGS
jgi:signal transduction histidine kinase